MPTASELITGSLRALNVVGAGETPDAADITLGLSVLNRMISAWRNKRLLIFHLKRYTYSLSANTASYTIGPGATFDQQRPNWIEKCGVIPDDTADPLLEIPLGPPMSAKDYAGVALKDLSGAYPSKVYYEKAFTGVGLGAIHVWPVPSGDSVDIALYCANAMQNFANTSTDYNLPDGFEEAIHYNLAIRLANEGFAAPIPDDVRRLAREALNDIKTANVDIPEAKFDRSLVGRRGRRDIRTGGR